MAFWSSWLKRLIEAGSPKPKEEIPFVEPVGYVAEIEPMGKADRSSPTALISAALRTAQERNRQARYRDFNLMDVGDIAAMLDAVVDASLTFEDVSTARGFKVEADDPSVQELFDTAIRDADLQQVAEEILRDGLKYGDGFAEPLFAAGRLVGVQTYKPEEIFVTRDDKGRLATGKDDDGFFVAFQQRRQGRTLAGWQPWEIIHFKLFPSRKLVYSERGLLDAIRADWKKLQLVEQGMVVARVTRAYPRRVHYIDLTGKDRQEQERTLSRYITRLTGRVFGQRRTDDNDLPVSDVGEDLYLATGYSTGPDGKPYPKLNKVETEDPAIAGLAEMADVSYLRQKLWAFVPSDVVGIKRNTTGDLDSQDLAYTRLLRRCQKQLEKFLRGIFDQVLLASGRLPGQVPYRVIMPAIDIRSSWKFADARFRHSLTLRNYLEVGAISRRHAVKQAFNLSDREVDLIWDEIAKEATNPIFMPMTLKRNGQLAVSTSADDTKDGEASTTIRVVPATGADADKDSTTNNGISRGTDNSMALSGHMSGGAG